MERRKSEKSSLERRRFWDRSRVNAQGAPLAAMDQGRLLGKVAATIGNDTLVISRWLRQ